MGFFPLNSEDKSFVFQSKNIQNYRMSRLKGHSEAGENLKNSNLSDTATCKEMKKTARDFEHYSGNNMEICIFLS